MEVTGLCFAEGDLQGLCLLDLQGLCLLADCRAAGLRRGNPKLHEQFLPETGLQDLFPLHD